MRIGPEDVVAEGGDLSVDTLLAAYRRGVFPWPVDDATLLWFCPRQRAVIEAARFHIPRSLAREVRRTTLRVTRDVDFAGVVHGCATSPRPGQDGTWITGDIADAYCALHQAGYAHSVEAWRDDALVGGVYGVDAGGAFSAESMFYRESDASKIALCALLRHVFERGASFVDVQVMNPHLARFGAHDIPRGEFLVRLATERRRNLDLFP